MATTAPTTEQGTPFDVAPSQFTGQGPLGYSVWSELFDDHEYVQELRWPNSRVIYDMMRSDPQIHGLWSGMTLPIRRYQWVIDPNGARKDVVQRAAEDWNLPIKGQPRKSIGRTARRFNHDDHLYHALLALVYGFIFFEQVGDQSDAARWRLRKFGPRMPHSIDRVIAARDGGLVGIRQNGSRDILGVNRLIAYVWQKEGANWYGRSMLRPMYKPWYVKDKLIRVDLVKHTRNGMGVPTAKQVDPDVSPAAMRKAQEIVRKWQAGQNAHTALPYGIDIELKGVSGSLPDTLASIRYADEQMAESMLMMFMKLGTQTSAGLNGGSLGENFLEFFSLAQGAVADWYCGITNEHGMEDWVDWNFGEDVQAPRIAYVNDQPEEYAVQDLVALIDAGAITVDDQLEEFLRAQGALPADWDHSTPRRAGTTPPADQSQTPPTPLQLAASSREPLGHEEHVDFPTIDKVWQDALARLLSKWSTYQQSQIEAIAAAIHDAKSLEDLAYITPPTLGSFTLRQELVNAAREGIKQALEEAAAQGVIPDRGVEELLRSVEGDMATRASVISNTLAQSLADAGRRSAHRLWGLPPAQVASETVDHLSGLSNSFLERQFSGALTQAMGTGRMAVQSDTDPAELYHSALLDPNTCANCRRNDGHRYANIAEAATQFPTGQYKDCLGLERCRCLVVAVYDETPGDF